MAETRPTLSLHTGKLHPDATGGGVSSSSSASRGGIESEETMAINYSLRAASSLSSSMCS
ncbi:hypothetical protein Dimus_010418 [Dionaea muscipula]